MSNTIVLEEFKNKYADIILLVYFIDSCNYNCSYCYNKRPYTNSKINVDKLFSFVKMLSENNTKKIAIEIIGGEPTIHPQLTKFIEKLQELSIVDICIFTNLSLPILYYTRLIDDYNVRFLATWHSLPYDIENRSFVDKIFNIDKQYFNKTNSINFRSLFVRIMLETNTFEYNCKLYEKILDLYPENVDISLIADPTKTADKNNINENNTMYTDELKITYKKLYSLCNTIQKQLYKVVFSNDEIRYLSFGDMFLNKHFSYYMYKCNAGNDYFYIHSNGDIFPCQSYYELNKKPLFNLSLNLTDFNKQKYTICRSKICSCDFGIRKERIFK